MRLQVIIPYMEAGPERANNLRWLLDRLGYLDYVVAEIPPGPWVKANAVNPAVEASNAEIVAVCDADVYTPGLLEAVAAVISGAGWAVPHTKVHRLTQAATGAVLAGEPPSAMMLTVERPYDGVIGGGCVVIPRKTALKVPLDPRFQGWGGEDHSWGYALQTLIGTPWRSELPLFHLWHPTQPRTNRKLGSRETERLRRQYRDAQIFEDDMRTLVESIPR